MGLNYSGETAAKDISKYVDAIFRNNEEIRSIYHARSKTLPYLLKQEITTGIQDAINAFMCEQKKERVVQTSNLFDLDVSRFVSQDYIKQPVVARISENVEIRKQLKKELVLNTFDAMMQSIAYIVSESYRGHVYRIFMDETGRHASLRGTRRSSR